ncbi:MFS transporter [Corynebacterium oculi]|uniref:Antiseptic resistance protein n=1 Tax=Corynebacterium oculi TaxID=1544416 RepID=A0A0Q0YBE9_9CORY|nr:MFS transporter [Corynebacterium oculi]KQB83280.1 Antiseptic resistance protein [Corynebacterium oculi]
MKTLSSRATAVMLLAAVLPLIDSSLVNVLLPAIGADFGVTVNAANPESTESSLQLGISGYMLAATVGIILSTTCLRRFGERRVWFASVCVFAVASALVGVAGTLPFFLAARVLQGLACGFIMPAVQGLVARIVGREGMRAALATIGLPAVVAPAVGPLLGGVLVDVVGWRALFLVNVPIAGIALILAPTALPRTRGSAASLGMGQALPAVLGMVGVLWAISGVGQQSILVTVSVLVVAAILIAVFCVLDLRSRTPLLDVSLYRGGAFAVAMLLCLVVGAVFYGTLLSTSLHVQSALHQPAWVAGVLLGVQGLGAWAARSLVRGRWKSLNAFALIGAGLLVAAAGTVGIQAIDLWGIPGAAALVGCSLARGVGLGACTLLALSAAYEVVMEDQTAAVGAHSRLMLQCGGAVGAAFVGAWGGSALALGLLIAVFAAGGAVSAFGLFWRQRCLST